MRIRSASLWLFGVLTLAAAVFAQTTPGQTKAPAAAGLDDRFQERVLARIPATYGEVVGGNVRVLPDGRTFGYLAPKGAKYAVIYNGKEVTELDPDPARDPRQGFHRNFAEPVGLSQVRDINKWQHSFLSQTLKPGPAASATDAWGRR